MYPNNYFDWLPVVYKLGGIHNQKHDKKYIKQFYYFYNSLIFISCALYLTAEWAALKSTSTNITKLIDHIGMLSIHNTGAIKIILLYKYWNQIKNIKNTLDSDEFKYDECGDFKPGKEIVKSRFYFRFNILVFVLLGTLVPTMKLYDGFVRYIKDGYLIDKGNLTCSDILPYYNWFPFDIDTTFRCGVSLFLQCIPMVLFVYPIIATDLTFAGMVIYVRGHFIILRQAFSTMKKRCLIRLNLPEDYSVFNDIMNPVLDKEIKTEIRKMTSHLQTMIKVVDELEYIYNLQMLLQVLGITFIFVSCLYIISNEEPMSPIFFAECEYMVGVMIELIMFASYGSEVTQQSSNVYDGIAECDWISCSKSVKSSLIINMMRLQKPIYLTLGKFSPLTLTTFIQILKISYSYFTYLQNPKNLN